MKNLKMFLSAGVFMLAIAGAFSTNAAKAASKSTTIPGYLQNGSACEYKRECQVSGNFLCTANSTSGSQIWGMDKDNHCVEELFRVGS